jgi:HNH endonuclease
MSLIFPNVERLGQRHYFGAMDRGRSCAFRIQSKRFEEKRQAHRGNFCVILHGKVEETDDYFVIPYQVLAVALDRARPTGPIGDGSEFGWDGAIADDTTLYINGYHLDVQIGSCYRDVDLLRWLIDGNDLFSFPMHRTDEAASGWPPYTPPRWEEGEKLKSLLDDSTKQSGRQAVARPGQAEFREALRQRYGDRCMVSDCPLMGVVEAAHIVPYSMAVDHHPANGLLLRADIHILFDLHLLGIEPESLAVSLHDEAKEAEYIKLGRVEAPVHHGVPPESRSPRKAMEVVPRGSVMIGHEKTMASSGHRPPSSP